MRPEFLPTLRKFFVLHCCQSLHTANRTQPNFAKRKEVNGADVSRIRWRRIMNINETIEIRSLISRSRNHFRLAMASRRAAFSGNTSSVATFSNLESMLRHLWTELYDTLTRGVYRSAVEHYKEIFWVFTPKIWRRPRQSGKGLETTKGFLHRPKISWTLIGSLTTKIGP